MSRSERGREADLDRRALTVAGASFAAAVLAGCATPRTAQPIAAQGVAAWSGRFAATWTDPADRSREDRAAGRFWLQTQGGRTELEIYSPFGQTVARAGADASNAWLETPDGRRYEAHDPQALTEQVLGWRIPVQRLPHWLRGELAAPPGSPTVDTGWAVVSDRAPGEAPGRLSLQWPHQFAATSPRSVTIRLALDESDGAGSG